MAPPYGEVTEELLRGRELAAQLHAVLRESAAARPAAREIVEEILRTFSRAIQALDAAKAAAAAAGGGAQEDAEEGSERTFGGKRKGAAAGDRRGGTRRRSQQSCNKVIITKSLEDGQAWRKYGQKEIHNSKYPRAYFRCTHKFDQGCMAQRQVQRSEEDPDSYAITYIGEHICRDPATISHIIDHTSDLRGSCLISFASNASTTTTTTTTTTATTGNHNDHATAALSSPLQTLKREVDQEEVFSSLTSGGGGGGATAVWPDQGDVTSSLHDIRFMDESFDLAEYMFDFMDDRVD